MKNAGNRREKPVLATTGAKIAALGIAVLIVAFAASFSKRFSKHSPSPSTSLPAHVQSPKKKWEFQAGNPVRRGTYSPPKTPAIDGNGIVYAAEGGALSAVNPDGSLIWDYRPQSWDNNSPVIADDGTLWLGTDLFGWVHKVQPYGGEGFLGIAPLQQVGTAFDGTLYLSGKVGFLAIDTQTAHTKWSGGGELFALLDSGDIVTSDKRGYVYLYSSTGDLKWLHKNPAQGCTAPALGTDGSIYVGCGRELQVLNSDGSGKWAFSAEDLVASPVIDNDGNVYFGSRDHKLYALATDGRLRWSFVSRGEIRTTPAISHNGRIFFGSSDGVLHALSTEKGVLLWEFKAGGAVYSPTIAPDGTIYAQSADGKLYAIEDTEPNGGLWGQWPKMGADLKNNSRGSR